MAKRNLFIFDVDSKESSKRKLTLSWRGEEDEVNLSLKAVQRYHIISTIAHFLTYFLQEITFLFLQSII